jgi:cobalt transporter subunit CbtB
MNTQQTLPIQTSVASASRLTQIGLAAFLGLFVVGFAPISQIEAIHNASHDVRHSLAFPCH